jgi:predicted dithiol-disulfide oxidoreductase (DUF899 family)
MGPRIGSQQQWLEARTALLEKEKQLTRLRDEVARERRALPWVRVEKRYLFDGPHGPVTLDELFAGRSQLFVKHYMLAPGQVAHCVGCALEVDHLEGILVHLENHDLSYAAVARAPIAEIETLRQRMGWRLPFVSSCHNDFNYDFHVSFRPADIAAGRAYYNYQYMNTGIEDLSGDSVFVKNEAGEIFHTYSTFGRGGEEFLLVYRFIDATPKGRMEDLNRSLTDWARPHDMYGQGGTVEPAGRFHASGCGCAVHGRTAPAPARDIIGG